MSRFLEEYDPWFLFGTDDPLIDDADFVLSDEEQQQANAEFENWCESLEEVGNDADIPY